MDISLGHGSDEAAGFSRPFLQRRRKSDGGRRSDRVCESAGAFSSIKVEFRWVFWHTGDRKRSPGFKIARMFFQPHHNSAGRAIISSQGSQFKGFQGGGVTVRYLFTVRTKGQFYGAASKAP